MRLLPPKALYCHLGDVKSNSSAGQIAAPHIPNCDL
jgi:hypothetical protein